MKLPRNDGEKLESLIEWARDHVKDPGACLVIVTAFEKIEKTFQLMEEEIAELHDVIDKLKEERKR